MSKDKLLNPEEDMSVKSELAAGENAGTAQAEQASSQKAEKDDGVTHHLSGMFRNWFLDYASYVILERAVPDIYDGLKPVQRRILHSMIEKEDGYFNKVANLVGHTMQYHPHGDASIGDALVQLGQKDLLIETQGNWGNLLTGDGAAAPRYIEARLTPFALETVFNPKTTEWKPSYDGKNSEPVCLPIKFPLLLSQGVEGIAVGLNSKILPHNFNELLDASIACLRQESFELYPDFQTGGSIDVSRYNDGERGGAVKIRAKISKLDNKTLVISEIPYSSNTSKLIESIIRANEKGKIKIRKVDDNTAANVEILVYLAAGVSSDKTIDALYAFTDCEISISPNCCVIHDQKPRFIGISEMLRISTEHTKSLLKQELEIQKQELQERFFYISLEKIFIENRIYKDKEFEEGDSQDFVLNHIEKRLEPFKKDFVRELKREDVEKLLEIKMRRITKFDADKANDNLISIQEKIAEINNHLENLVDYTVAWFEKLKTKYGQNRSRRTEIRNFESIEASKVVEATEKLYVNYEEGFIGTGLKKDVFVCNCSDIDDIIVFFKDGKYKIVKAPDKMFVGKNILHVDVFKRNDKRTIYNIVYRNGKSGAYYIKRCAVTGITREKEYDLTQGEVGSRIAYFTVNPNGEAEIIRIKLKRKKRITKLELEKDFKEIAIKGRQSMGNILTKNDVEKISLKQRGSSTLGGRKVWFDSDVLRLNYDGRGNFLGEFHSEDQILVVSNNGEYYTCSFDLTNHFENDIFRIEKFDSEKVWAVVLFDGEQKKYYLKRFQFEATRKNNKFIGENANSKLILISDEDYPRFEVTFGGSDKFRENQEIDAESFIGVKGYKARGKRITSFKVKEIKELTPLRFAEKAKKETDFSDETETDDNASETIQGVDATDDSPQIIEAKLELEIDVPFEVVVPGGDEEYDQQEVAEEAKEESEPNARGVKREKKSEKAKPKTDEGQMSLF